ncbi:hypothetical protein PF003_g1281 [Phytophthora fragariae]|nr:hypothetical protein PF003_g1281 [Phytophthora fragariae]
MGSVSLSGVVNATNIEAVCWASTSSVQSRRTTTNSSSEGSVSLSGVASIEAVCWASTCSASKSSYYN